MCLSSNMPDEIWELFIKDFHRLFINDTTRWTPSCAGTSGRKDQYTEFKINSDKIRVGLEKPYTIHWTSRPTSNLESLNYIWKLTGPTEMIGGKIFLKEQDVQRINLGRSTSNDYNGIEAMVAAWQNVHHGRKKKKIQRSAKYDNAIILRDRIRKSKLIHGVFHHVLNLPNTPSDIEEVINKFFETCFGKMDQDKHVASICNNAFSCNQKNSARIAMVLMNAVKEGRTVLSHPIQVLSKVQQEEILLEMENVMKTKKPNWWESKLIEIKKTSDDPNRWYEDLHVPNAANLIPAPVASVAVIEPVAIPMDIDDSVINDGASDLSVVDVEEISLQQSYAALDSMTIDPARTEVGPRIRDVTSRFKAPPPPRPIEPLTNEQIELAKDILVVEAEEDRLEIEMLASKRHRRAVQADQKKAMDQFQKSNDRRREQSKADDAWELPPDVVRCEWPDCNRDSEHGCTIKTCLKKICHEHSREVNPMLSNRICIEGHEDVLGQSMYGSTTSCASTGRSEVSVISDEEMRALHKEKKVTAEFHAQYLNAFERVVEIKALIHTWTAKGLLYQGDGDCEVELGLMNDRVLTWCKLDKALQNRLVDLKSRKTGFANRLNDQKITGGQYVDMLETEVVRIENSEYMVQFKQLKWSQEELYVKLTEITSKVSITPAECKAFFVAKAGEASTLGANYSSRKLQELVGIIKPPCDDDDLSTGPLLTKRALDLDSIDEWEVISTSLAHQMVERQPGESIENHQNRRAALIGKKLMDTQL